MKNSALLTALAFALACSPGADAPDRTGDGTSARPDAAAPAGVADTAGASDAARVADATGVADDDTGAAGNSGITDAARAADAAGTGVVLFLGNSLTAGYGLPADQAYPALIQRKIDAAGYRFRVVNAGVSGETSAGGLRRIDWVLRQPVAVLVLALGANDALRGQDLDATRANLQAIIDRTRAVHPGAAIVIAGMQAPPNLGSAYTERFRRMFIELAEANDAALIPFLLEGVAAVPKLNQEDGIHPNAEGQRIVAENVWRTLEPVLRRLARDAR
ncbi:MAG TPA: arylesterase [Longimicrobiales bacterium]